MYLMYVDEAGDCGIDDSPTDIFVLSGLVIHELSWQTSLDQLVSWRRNIKAKFGLGMRDELHAAQFLSSPGELVRIPKYDRLAILRSFADQLATMSDLNFINVVVDKKRRKTTDEVFEFAWTILIQRFENTISYRNFAGPRNVDDRGMLFPDRTDVKKLVALLRKMRHFNPIPSKLEYGAGSRNIKITKIIEDPNFRDSETSFFIQAADLATFLLYQQERPNSYMRKKGGRNYFARLEPVLCKKASSKDALGVVRV